MDVRSELMRFIRANFLLGAADKIEHDDSFLARNLIDSTGVLELVGHLETVYGIAVEDEEIVPENLDTVDNIVRFLQDKGAAIGEVS